MAKLPVEKGGLNFPDVLASWQAFKFSWIKRWFFLSTGQKWKKILEQSLADIDPLYTFDNFKKGMGDNSYNIIAKKIYNPFWKETFKVAKLLTLGYLKKNPVEIIYCCIWSSHLFMKNNAMCTRADFGSLYKKISMPIDILKAGPRYEFSFLS